MTKHLLLIILLMGFRGLLCGQEFLSSGKISPTLLSRTQNLKTDALIKIRLTTNSKTLPVAVDSIISTSKLVAVYKEFSFFDITCSASRINDIINVPEIIFVDDATRVATDELQIGNLDLSVNKINAVHQQFPQINGDGIVVSVKENKPDTTDIDLRGRFLTTNLSSTTISSHATIMSTMIAGAGNTWHLGKGVAWGGTLSSSSYAILLPESNAAYQQYGISVQNHSYGVGLENFYGADAAAYDASAISNPSLLHVFSSGNSGSAAPATGIYTGINGFANMTGSFKMAKNVIKAGATDSFSVVATLSSKGPANDGRLGPDIVAFGEDGSSGSAALVSGSVMLLQQAYKQTTGVLPPNALVKAILLNSADDIGNKEVDYSSGFGALNTLNAMKTLASGRYLNGTVSAATAATYNINIPAGIKKVKVMLVWNDPAAAPNAAKALINDLDLEVLYPAGSLSWRPWVLSKYPHPDSLQLPATRKRDSLNNAEQVTIDNPVAGAYQLSVKAFSIATANQTFYLAYQFDSTDQFEWQFPLKNDFIFPSQSNTIRWRSSYSVSTGKLEFSSDNGNSWVTINNAIDLSKGFYQWNTPALTSTALLRITVGSNQFVSDEFTIAARTTTGVGFYCPDSFMLYWNKLPAVSAYRVYELGQRYLVPFTVTTDSFLVLSKMDHPSLHYAVAPLIGVREAVRSYTINYSSQGVDCYIRSFIGSLVNSNTTELQLLLGTLYNVNKIILEKYNGSSFIPVRQITPVTTTTLLFSDNQLTKGLNMYRARIELGGGRIVYSGIQTVNYFASNNFIVYPVPARTGEAINILNADVTKVAKLTVVNMMGQIVYRMDIDNVTNIIPAGQLRSGIYLLHFTMEDGTTQVIKTIVLN